MASVPEAEDKCVPVGEKTQTNIVQQGALGAHPKDPGDLVSWQVRRGQDDARIHRLWRFVALAPQSHRAPHSAAPLIMTSAP
jgi:hypothetical protein